MTSLAQAALLPDGRRLHLHHGPIDIIAEAFGPERDVCYRQAVARFETILIELVKELPALRAPLDVDGGESLTGPVARRMARAARAHGDTFVTPMAAVAGAVADEVLAAMIAGRNIARAYANNGGDIAFHLARGEVMTVAGAAGLIEVPERRPSRGVATSGWRGRSHSLGVADAATALAATAAEADVAATLIANAVDLPGHPAITRAPASELAPDSDLSGRLVTTDVAALTPTEIDAALDRGEAVARRFLSARKIEEAAITLQGRTRVIASPAEIPTNGAYADA